MITSHRSTAKPFIKWAGGKSQLLPQLEELLPSEMRQGEAQHYCEPFLGGGAMFFHLWSTRRIKSARLSDVNPDLIGTYVVVKEALSELLEVLSEYANEYFSKTREEQSDLYYELRNEYNSLKKEPGLSKTEAITCAALFIFLNKTCYNGLHRVNKNGDFNVPFGSYKNPQIVDRDNLIAVSRALEIAELSVSSYEKLLNQAVQGGFVYFDPPYRPVSKTASFTAYSNGGFNDSDQINLARVFQALAAKGLKLMLSNSDSSDGFFDSLYSGFIVSRVNAKRFINCDSTGRGSVSEVVITNYEVKDEVSPLLC